MLVDIVHLRMLGLLDYYLLHIFWNTQMKIRQNSYRQIFCRHLRIRQKSLGKMDVRPNFNRYSGLGIFVLGIMTGTFSPCVLACGVRSTTSISLVIKDIK